MELVQTLLIAISAVASQDSLDRIVKVKNENNWRIRLESKIQQPKQISLLSVLHTKFKSKSGHKITEYKTAL